MTAALSHSAGINTIEKIDAAPMLVITKDESGLITTINLKNAMITATANTKPLIVTSPSSEPYVVETALPPRNFIMGEKACYRRGDHRD